MNLYYYFKDKNYPIYVSNDTLKLTSHTFLNNQEMWEESSIKYFYSKISREKSYNIIDIGAQSGLYTLFAKYLPNSNFYAFEPFKPTFNILNDNILLNNINNVKTFNIGLSNKKEELILNTCKSHNGLHTLGNNPLRFNDIEQIKIEVDTIDNLFYNNNIPVDFIKIDTEGWEYNILKGGVNTIKKFKPLIQLEWSENNMLQCNINENDLNQLIYELGYKKHNQISEELFIIPNNFS
jgi:FkbM family methyltransferase